MRKCPVLSSHLFDVYDLKLSTGIEKIVDGGRDKFALLPNVFNEKQVAVIGWGKQGPSHAQNLRDSLKDSGSTAKVVVGLREGSGSFGKAKKAGFSKSDGTLGDMYEVIAESDIVILLIGDFAQAGNIEKVMSKMKSGATLGLAHGFILSHMNNNDIKWRKDINVIMLAPKGMGESVRVLYLQGKEINGAGINASIAIEQQYSKDAMDIAIAWGIAIGSPYIFETTMLKEYLSDIFGERGVLLGGVHALVETLYSMFISDDVRLNPNEAYEHAVDSLTGPISKVISKKGLLGLYEQVSNKEEFKAAYTSFYQPSLDVLRQIYEEVLSGREVQEVIDKGSLEDTPIEPVDTTEMWQVGKEYRANRTSEIVVDIDSYTAGAYAAMMMAQVRVLLENGHSGSEVCNETIIEAVDSLNPFMHKDGAANMIDGCSITARRGAIKWGPIFQKAFKGIKLLDAGGNEDLIQEFLSHAIHRDLEKVSEKRPATDISL